MSRITLLALAFLTPFGVLAAAEPPPQVTLIAPGVWQLRFGQPEPFTPVTFRSAPLASQAFTALPACQSPFDPAQIHFVTTDHGCTVSLPLASGEKIYGFGLNTALFEMSSRPGQPITIHPSDHPEKTDNFSHAPIPFYLSTQGYGVYLDTARAAVFYPNAAADKDSMRADIPVAHGVDVYLFGGPAMEEAVQRYNLFSGGGCVPPLWGLGMAFRSSADFNGKEILALAQSFRDLHMPCDIWGLEPCWQSHAYSCTFTWNQGNFPDPAAFTAKMLSENYHLNLWEHCYTDAKSPIYPALKPFSGDQPVWNGLVPDFATADARKIFQDHHDKLLFANGVEAMKLDECDWGDFSYPDSSKFPSGLDGEQMHSLLGVLYQQTMWAPLKNRNVRTWGLVRDSHALATPLPYTLYSDSYKASCYLRGLAKEGFGGVLWTPEVRDAKSVEDLYRRIEMTIFSPYAMVNCWYMKLPPWEQLEKNASNRGVVMPNHQEAEDVVRSLFQLRMSFVPYLYAAFNEYHLHGTPPIRALVMDWPNDPATFNIDDQFMFGPSVLVAPILTGQTKRNIYLPAGTWHDYWTGETLTGGRSIEVAKPLDQTPLYVKDNTLLPLAKPLEHIAADTCFDLTVRVYGKNPLAMVLYEDDGISYDYEQGKQNRVSLKWVDGKGTVEKEGGYTGPARYQVVNWDSVAQ